MKWASATGTGTRLDQALEAAIASLREGMGDDSCDLLVAFVTPHYAAHYELVPKALSDAFPDALLLGCSAGGVLGAGEELEDRPGVALAAASLPGVELHPFHLDPKAITEVLVSPFGLYKHLSLGEDSDPAFLLLPEPFTCDGEGIISSLEAAWPNAVCVGGLASGARHPGGNVLYLGDELHPTGVVGIGLCGNVVVDTIVAQGCRPIGRPYVATRCEGTYLYELDGQPATEVLEELYESLSPAEQDRVRTSLFLGLVQVEGQEHYVQGDFLIRNLIGMDPDEGVLAVGARLTPHQVVQFHLRDAETSRQDLQALLERQARQGEDKAASGALLFSCLGRGQHLYGVANHDSTLFLEQLGEVPLAGFFCNGEIGPVGGRTFLHGFTSSFGLFRPRSP